jgi:hypothetical protein
MNDDEEVGDIRASCDRCMKRFKALLENMEFEKSWDRLTVEDINNEFARFKIWAGNLGVLQRGSTSLDARLRDSILLRNAILRLLKSLADSLMNG